MVLCGIVDLTMPRLDFDTDPQTRQRMRNVQTKDTPPERVVRSILHRAGYRFTLRRNDLPGKPDIVLPKYHTAIFAHGCFWHGHKSCDKGTRRPKRNADFWESKIKYNMAKDLRVTKQLEHLGWQVIVVWECEIKNRVELENRLKEELKKV